jgi:tripartite-type tricarboxylate transporter receptor subunit TctC
MTVMSSRRTALLRLAQLGLLATAPLPMQANAQTYPDKPIRFIVPYGPGGATDVAARIVAEAMGRILKQTIVIENKAGANGQLALQAVALAAPDGYTLLLGNVTTQTINPLIKGDAAVAAIQSQLAVVSRLVEVPAVLVATKKDFSANTMAEFVAAAKAKPEPYFYNASGILSYSHLDMLELQKRAGIKLSLVPVSAGGGSSQTEIISGQVQLALRNVASALPFIKSGQLRALAVTPDSRLPILPEVPTMKEQGYAGIGTNAWQALFAPAKTPEAVLAVLSAAALAALKDPAVVKRFEELAITVVPSTSQAEARQWLKDELARWQPIVADAVRQGEGKP